MRPGGNSHGYDSNSFFPQFGTVEVRPEYWDSLMSSSYAVQLQRIYGVSGSEYVGYGQTDLHIVPSNEPAYPRNPNPIEVSSNGSSTEVKIVGETGPVPTPLDKGVYLEIGKLLIWL